MLRAREIRAIKTVLESEHASLVGGLPYKLIIIYIATHWITQICMTKHENMGDKETGRRWFQSGYTEKIILELNFEN